MGNGLNAVGFIYSNADMSSADVDCDSVAHNSYYNRPLPAVPKYDMEIWADKLIFTIGFALSGCSPALQRTHDLLGKSGASVARAGR